MSSKKEFTVRPFEKLRKTMERNAVADAPPAPCRKKKEEYTDDELFIREMDDVQAIEAFRRLNCGRNHPRSASPKARLDPDREALTVLGEIAAGERPMHLPDTQEYVEWANPEYRDDLTRKLHEGRFSVQAFLDLHGCTVPEAEEELGDFLRDAVKKGLHCVKIIHGRGLRSVKGPRIKDAVTRRLASRYQRNVIAYVTARQCDGGLGALYVLLRK
jgi:DNA-nicking Smr family endonuclease